MIPLPKSYLKDVPFVSLEFSFSAMATAEQCEAAVRARGGKDAGIKNFMNISERRSTILE